MTTETAILQTQTVAVSAPGWSVPLSFNQFNPSTGTLADVDVGIVGEVTGTAAIQNLGATAATLLITLPGTIDVAADGTVLASVTPEAATAVNLGAYDGTTDFTGTSGTVVAGFSNVATAVSDYIPGTGTAVAFVGTGTIDLTASSQVRSNLYADGNLLSLTQGEAGATVSVQYDYQSPGDGSYDDSSSSSTFGYWGGIYYPYGDVTATTAPQTLAVSDRTTDWNTVVTANQFNPALGTLLSVNLTVTGDINAGLAVENLGSTPSSIGLTETADITLTLPSGLGIATAAPSIQSSTDLAAFDGSIDFAGPSGENLTGLTGTESTTASEYGNLSAFIGTGTIALPISATSPSILTGPADLASELLTEAGATVTISYTYAVPDGSGPIDPSPSSAALTISGTEAGQGVTDQTTVAPFANVLINDPNVAQTETVTITQSAAANGTLSNLGGGHYNATTEVYTDTGSAAAVTAALDGLIFTPAAVAPGQTITTGFTITDTDTLGLSVTDATTSVAATAGVFINTASAAAAIVAELRALAVPPTITGSVAGQAVTDHASIKPFASVVIADQNVAEIDTVTVTLSAANGTLTNLGGGHYNAAMGVYTDSGSAAAVTAALDGLLFTPKTGQVAVGRTVTTDFTIADTDTLGASATNRTTSVIATAINAAPGWQGISLTTDNLGIGATGPTSFIQTGTSVIPPLPVSNLSTTDVFSVGVQQQSSDNTTIPFITSNDFALDVNSNPVSGADLAAGFSATAPKHQQISVITPQLDSGVINSHPIG
jgi:hypothetical protein